MTLYDAIGGHAGVARLIERFYDRLEADREAALVHAMHVDVERSRARLTLFVCAWLGGPLDYHRRYGQPRLDHLHRDLPIDEAAADAWMRCMRQALAETITDAQVRERIDGMFTRVADYLVDQAKRG